MSIGGTGPSDIWVNGTVHYDGIAWTEIECGPLFTSLSVSPTGAMIGVNGYGIEYFSGNEGWPFLARTYVAWRTLEGRDPANIWAVGERGAVIRYQDNRWSGQDFPLPFPDEALLGAFGTSPSDIWGISTSIIHGSGLVHFDGSGWTSVDAHDPYFWPRAGFAMTPNDAVAVDGSRSWHWDGSRWSEITPSIFGNDSIDEFWGSGPDDVWAIGGNYFQQTGSIYHWDGKTWQRVYGSSRGRVTHVGGSARDDVWFAILTVSEGDRTLVLHWDGDSFTELDSFRGRAFAIMATSPNDVWLPFYGQLRHYDGVGWTSQPLNNWLTRALGVRGAGVFFTSLTGNIYQSR